MSTYNFATTHHDHTTQLRKVHIASEDGDKWVVLCGYKDGMLDGGEQQTTAQVTAAIKHDPDGFICARCVKAFEKSQATKEAIAAAVLQELNDRAARFGSAFIVRRVDGVWVRTSLENGRHCATLQNVDVLKPIPEQTATEWWKAFSLPDDAYTCSLDDGRDWVAQRRGCVG